MPDSKTRTAIFDAITKAVIDGNVHRLKLNSTELESEEETTQQLLDRVQVIDEHATISDDRVSLSLDARPITRGRTVRAKTHLLDDAEAKQVLAELVQTSHRKLKSRMLRRCIWKIMGR